MEDFQKNGPYAHRFYACDSFFDYHSQGNSKQELSLKKIIVEANRALLSLKKDSGKVKGSK